MGGAGAGSGGTAVAAALQVAANVGAGGWAEWLGRPASDLLTADDVERITRYVMGRVMADPIIATALLFPLSSGLALAQLKNTEDAIRAGLTARIGQPLSSIPADLGKLDEVKRGVPGINGPATGWGDAGDWIGQLVAGAGDIAAHGLLLAGILAVLLLGLWYLFRDGTGAASPLDVAASVAGR